MSALCLRHGGDCSANLVVRVTAAYLSCSSPRVLGGSESGGLKSASLFGSRMVRKHKATSAEFGFTSWYTKLVAGVVRVRVWC